MVYTWQEYKEAAQGAVVSEDDMKSLFDSLHAGYSIAASHVATLCNTVDELECVTEEDLKDAGLRAGAARVLIRRLNDRWLT